MRKNLVDAIATLGFMAAILHFPSVAQAKEAVFFDGFENGNQQGWASTGEVVLQSNQGASAIGAPHSGSAFLALRQNIPGPGVSITNTIGMPARKGDTCSLQVWLRQIMTTGAVQITVKDGFAAGTTLASRTISANAMKGARRDQGYVPYRLNFKHTGNLLFVSLDGFGPLFLALDDVKLTCRTR